MFPAARIGDPVTHDMTIPSGVIGPMAPAPCPLCAAMPVIIEMLPAAHVGCTAICTGVTSLGPIHPPPVPPAPPPPIVKGSLTVLIHNMPAARWTPAPDFAACMSFLGDPKLVMTRRVLIGDIGMPGSSIGLGAGFDKLAALSPKLMSNFDELRKQGWNIRVGPAGKGSYADRNEKVIVIDANELGNDTAMAQTFAHETGHAMYTPDPYTAPAPGMTKNQYVQANVNSNLKDEGEATLTNIEIKNEILANGGPDIGIAGANGAKYEAAAAKYPNPADRDLARQEVGNEFAHGEVPSVPKDDGTSYKDYQEYYEKPFADHWDNVVVPSGGP